MPATASAMRAGCPRLPPAAPGCPTHLSTVRSVLRKLRGIAGAKMAEDFGPRALYDVRNTLVAAGWTRDTINTHVTTIIRVFPHGVVQEMIGPDLPQALACVEHLLHHAP